MNEELLNQRESINKTADVQLTLSEFTKEQIANIVLFLGANYHCYYCLGHIFILDISTNYCVGNFQNYQQFVEWYYNLASNVEKEIK